VIVEDGHPDVVVVGASAGGVNALIQLVGGIPTDLAASVFVVLHLPRNAPSALAAILARSGPLPATTATDGEQPRPGHIYVAPTNHHLLIIDGRIRLSQGPTESGHRPAIDPTLRSAARAHGPRVIGVVLSGSRDDGSSGLAAVAARGGYTVVQDPDDALHPSMPRAALARVTADHVLPATKIGPLLGELTAGPLRPQPAAPPADEALLSAEVEVANLSPMPEAMRSRPAGYGCPDCGGALFEITGEAQPRFRCRVGHAWSPESLLATHSEKLQEALWQGLRALEEKAALATRMAHSAESRRSRLGERYHRMAADNSRAAEILRGLIAGIGELDSADGG